MIQFIRFRMKSSLFLACVPCVRMMALAFLLRAKMRLIRLYLIKGKREIVNAHRRPISMTMDIIVNGMRCHSRISLLCYRLAGWRLRHARRSPLSLAPENKCDKTTAAAAVHCAASPAFTVSFHRPDQSRRIVAHSLVLGICFCEIPNVFCSARGFVNQANRKGARSLGLLRSLRRCLRTMFTRFAPPPP